MTRALIGLALLCALLLGALALAGDGARDEAQVPQLVRLDSALRTPREPVAGLSLAWDGNGERVMYARARGVWRCVTLWGAPADGEHIESVLNEVLGAVGVVRAHGAEAQALYGVVGVGSLELRLHGRKLVDDPAGDVLLALLFGEPNPASGAGAAGTFVSLATDPTVVEVSFQPSRRIGGITATGLPPLLALRLGPPGFPLPGEGVERVILEYRDGPSFEIVRAKHEPIPPAPGQDPNLSLAFAWQLIDGQGARPIPPLRGEAFSTWVLRAPYDLLDDPREFATHGLDAPELRLTLVPSAGDGLVLEVGQADGEGRRWVLCSATPLLARLDPAMSAMIAPDEAELSDSTRPNPWDVWLLAAATAAAAPTAR